jgi:hypothetical protein
MINCYLVVEAKNLPRLVTPPPAKYIPNYQKNGQYSEYYP